MVSAAGMRNGPLAVMRLWSGICGEGAVRPVAVLGGRDCGREPVTVGEQHGGRRQIADALNAAGFRPPKRTSRFTGEQVRALIDQRGIPRQHKGRPAVLTSLPPGQWSVPGLAAELGMPVPTIYTWIYRGWITASHAPESRCWIITADDQQIRKLRERRARPPGYYTRARWNPPSQETIDAQGTRP